MIDAKASWDEAQPSKGDFRALEASGYPWQSPKEITSITKRYEDSIELRLEKSPRPGSPFAMRFGHHGRQSVPHGSLELVRIQAFAITEHNGRKSVAVASMRAVDRGQSKAVASPQWYVYFDCRSGVFFSNRLRSTLIENEIAKLSPNALSIAVSNWRLERSKSVLSLSIV
jgi:hypothetical protein